MAKITLDSIRDELSKFNWKVLSSEYSNLDTEMEFECDEHHLVATNWKKLRSHVKCPICENNKLKHSEHKIKVKPKGANVTRILAFDQATFITGYAIFDNNQLVDYNAFRFDEADEIERDHKIKERLISMINTWKPDLVALEGIQYQQNFGVTTFATLARLQGILMECCFDLGVDYHVCPTNTWRAHCGVRGRTRTDKKKSMQLLVKSWYDITVSDDCADAIGIGKYMSENFTKTPKIQKWE